MAPIAGFLQPEVDATMAGQDMVQVNATGLGRPPLPAPLGDGGASSDRGIRTVHPGRPRPRLPSRAATRGPPRRPPCGVVSAPGRAEEPGAGRDPAGPDRPGRRWAAVGRGPASPRPARAHRSGRTGAAPSHRPHLAGRHQPGVLPVDHASARMARSPASWITGRLVRPAPAERADRDRPPSTRT